jgi:hypothetical protein
MAARTSISEGASDIRVCVGRREYAEAVRRFEALARALRPRERSDVAADVARVGGADTRQALAKAFARAPCYLCDHGRMTCEVCGGTPTFAANGRFCETCNGHGHSPCLFCGGSGFLPVDDIPGSILQPAARMRLEWAARLLRQVIGEVKALGGEGDSAAPIRDWFRLFQAVERVRAILDDTGRAVRTGPAAAEHAQTTKLADECDRLTRKCRRSLATTIVRLCRAKAEAEEPGSRRRITWERQSEFYAAQARSSSS